MSPRPIRTPVGLRLTRTARVVSRAFDDALSGAGGSLPVWLVLLNLKTRRVSNQRELAEAVGVREATLTHHLNAMERDGLLHVEGERLEHVGARECLVRAAIRRGWGSRQGSGTT